MKNEEAFRSFFERNNAVMLLIEPCSGVIVDANPSSARFYGYSRKELCAMRIQDINILSEQELAAERQRTLAEKCNYFVFPHRLADGTVRTVEVHSTPVGVSGRQLLFSIIHDITERKLAEEALLNSESRLHTLVQTIPDLIWLKDAEGVYLACNKMFERLFGAKEADIIGKTDYDFVDRDLADFFREHDRKAMAADKPSSNEEWITFADDGHRALLDTIKTPMFDAEGKLVGVLGIARDITERKRAEEKLQESEARYRRITEGLTDYLYTVRVENGRAVETTQSPACSIVTGYTAEEFAADPYLWIQMVVPEDRETVREHVRQILEGKDVPPLEHRIRRKDGEIRWVSDTTVLFRDASGKLLSYDGVIRDITERKKMDDSIRKGKEEWEDTFDTINEAITIHDNEFNILRANRAARELLALPFLSLPRPKCYESYHGAGAPPIGCPSCQTMKSGKASVTEIFEPHLNRHLELKALPRFDSNGNMIGSVHVVRDITERKRLEDQLLQAQKMEAVGLLAGGIAHDFNNMLSAIISAGNMLKMKTAKSSPQLSLLEQILSAANKSAALTQQLLAFSRKQIISPRETDLNGLVNNLQKLLARLMGEDIELKIEIKADLLISLVDPVQIDQVLLNLCTNARDSMPEGGILSVRTEAVTMDSDAISLHGLNKPGRYALISVSDTGEGMKEETRQRIFEPFFTTKEVGRGTGLGLSIVYGIIKQHDGDISVYSEPGEGTTFKIYLPLVQLTPEEDIAAEQDLPEGGTETILLAEDSEEVRVTSRFLLEEFGYRIIEAVDGEDAIYTFLENKDKIDIVILDVIMPKRNGREAAGEMKKIRPDVKVLFTSGYTAEVLHRKGIKEDGIDFISKPTMPRDFLAKIREILDHP